MVQPSYSPTTSNLSTVFPSIFMIFPKSPMASRSSSRWFVRFFFTGENDDFEAFLWFSKTWVIKSRDTLPPQKNDRWFPYLFTWTMGELGKKSGCEILRSRVRPWWRSWLPSSMRSAERWLGGETVTRLMNLKLWWDSLDSGTAYIYILYYKYIYIYIYIYTYIDLCVCVFVECSAYVKRSLCFQEIPEGKHLNLHPDLAVRICRTPLKVEAH